MTRNRVSARTEYRDATITDAFHPPDGSLTDADFTASNAGRLATEKRIGQQQTNYWVNNVSSGDELYLYAAEGDGTIEAFQVSVESAPTGAYSYTVDLLRSNEEYADAYGGTGGADYQTVLTGSMTVDNSIVNGDAYGGTIDSAKSTVTKGDVFRVSVTRSGGSGTEASDWLFNIVITEHPY